LDVTRQVVSKKKNMTKLLLLLLLTVQIVSGFVAYSSGGSKFPAKAQINEISVSNGRRAVISQSTAEACVVDLDLATVKWGVCATGRFCLSLQLC